MGQILGGSTRVVVVKWGVKQRLVILRKTEVDGTEQLIKFKTLGNFKDSICRR